MNIFFPVFLALIAARIAELTALSVIDYYRRLKEYERALKNQTGGNQTQFVEDGD